MSKKTKGYYQTMAEVVKSHYSDEDKQELTGLLTKTLADRMWAAFESGELEDLMPHNTLSTIERAYKAGVMSLAAWMISELEEDEGGEEEGGEEEDEEEDKNMRIRFRMGLN